MTHLPSVKNFTPFATPLLSLAVRGAGKPMRRFKNVQMSQERGLEGPSINQALGISLGIEWIKSMMFPRPMRYKHQIRGRKSRETRTGKDRSGGGAGQKFR